MTNHSGQCLYMVYLSGHSRTSPKKKIKEKKMGGKKAERQEKNQRTIACCIEQISNINTYVVPFFFFLLLLGIPDRTVFTSNCTFPSTSESRDVLMFHLNLAQFRCD